jgi:periplasmic divalent cation tolerance protein
MADDTRFVVGLMTAPSAAAAGLARQLVGEGLAACVNIAPAVESIYRWDGDIQEESESLMVVKTTGNNLPAILDMLEATHPYEVFEFITLPVEGGNGRYLRWVADSVRPPES